MPSSSTHFLLGFAGFGIAYWLATSFFHWELTIIQIGIGLVLTLLASQFPDIDTPNSKIAEALYSVLILLAVGGIAYWHYFQQEIGIWFSIGILLLFLLVISLKHRGITHSYPIAVLSAGIFYFIQPVFGLFWFFGYFSHVFSDQISSNGKGKYL